MPVDDTPEAPKYITADELNSAITGHLKRAEAKQADTLKALLASEFAKLTPPKADPVVETDSKAKPVAPEMAALQEQLKTLQTTMQAERSRAEAAEQKQRNDKAFIDLKAALGKTVRPELLDIAAENLFHAKRRVEFDEAGNALFKTIRQTPGFADDEVLMPLADGVASFLKSKEAAVYLPAPGGASPNTAARGSRIPQVSAAPLQQQYTSPANTDEEKVMRAMERVQAIKSSRDNA